MARTPSERRERRQRHQHKHRSADSGSDLLPRKTHREEYTTSPSKSRAKKQRYGVGRDRTEMVEESEVSKSTSNALSAGSLAQLDALNDKRGWSAYDGIRAQDREARTYDEEEERAYRRQQRELRREKRRKKEAEDHDHRRKRDRRGRRVVSGTKLERGGVYYEEDDVVYEHRLKERGGAGSDDYDAEARRRKRRRIFIIAGVLVAVLVVAVAVGVTLSKKSSSNSDNSSATATSSGEPSNTNLDGVSESSIPKSAQGTVLDPFTWYDTTDFNVTYTAETVGGLSVMGLNSTWDDSTQANANVPALNDSWEYGTMPVRGVNLGGWLSIEPFITPSFFSSYTTHDNVVDEYTLSAKLGASKAASTLEEHYSSFVNESTFADIQAAGFDHVRIPFSYWAVTTYDGDPYVPLISWRYLLRGIEWARKYGLRINLDLHGAPGSQNGWNHSGRQGTIGWLNGTDGALNGQRTIDIHNQLSTFFTQARYKNIVTMYGLVNEPRMVILDTDTVLNWTTSAITTIRNNNFTGIIVFGDGFMGLDNWQGKLQNIDNLLLDVHQYVIFNTDQIALNHSDKLNFACGGWTAQTLRSEDTSTGFGPTMCGEWSQADTDCAQYLNNVGVGSRWEGTLNMASTPGGSDDGSVLSPTCPTDNNPRCSCDNANADPSTYSDAYKQWLLQFAEAQMHSFEKGWGWFYWTWQTESATQWSYKAGLAAGIMPQKAYDRNYNCSSIPDFASMGLPEYY